MLDFLFWTLIIIIAAILLLPVILAGMGIGILRHFSREMNDAKEQKQHSKKGFSWSSARKSARQDTTSGGKQKVFADNEGTYVDFEEVKE